MLFPCRSCWSLLVLSFAPCCRTLTWLGDTEYDGLPVRW